MDNYLHNLLISPQQQFHAILIFFLEKSVYKKKKDTL